MNEDSVRKIIELMGQQISLSQQINYTLSTLYTIISIALEDGNGDSIGSEEPLHPPRTSKTKDESHDDFISPKWRESGDAIALHSKKNKFVTPSAQVPEPLSNKPLNLKFLLVMLPFLTKEQLSNEPQKAFTYKNKQMIKVELSSKVTTHNPFQTLLRYANDYLTFLCANTELSNKPQINHLFLNIYEPVEKKSRKCLNLLSVKPPLTNSGSSKSGTYSANNSPSVQDISEWLDTSVSPPRLYCTVTIDEMLHYMYYSKTDEDSSPNQDSPSKHTRSKIITKTASSKKSKIRNFLNEQRLNLKRGRLHNKDDIIDLSESNQSSEVMSTKKQKFETPVHSEDEGKEHKENEM